HKPFKLIRWFMSHFKFYSALLPANLLGTIYNTFLRKDIKK
ncbi:hypothetical protein, partial [Acinetobacter baumannii]